MFNSISWQQFLITMGLMVGAYYLLTFLLFYHREILDWFNNRKKMPEAARPEEQPPTNLMGKVQPEAPRPTRKETVTTEELIFSPEQKVEGNHEQPEPDRMLSGSVADLLQEIQSLADAIREGNGSAEDAMKMFQSLLARYPNIKSRSFREAITIVIQSTLKDTCQLHFELNEIRQWWEIQ